MTTSKLATGRAGWFRPEDCRLDEFREVVEQATDRADYPYADSVEQGVLVYGSRLRDHAATPEHRREVQAELARALLDGPGIVVFTGAFPDPSVVDRASAVFAPELASVGLSPADITMAVAGRSDTAHPPYIVWGLRFGSLRGDAHGFAELRDGFIQLSLRGQRDCRVVVLVVLTVDVDLVTVFVGEREIRMGDVRAVPRVVGVAVGAVTANVADLAGRLRVHGERAGLVELEAGGAADRSAGQILHRVLVVLAAADEHHEPADADQQEDDAGHERARTARALHRHRRERRRGLLHVGRRTRRRTTIRRLLRLARLTGEWLV